MLLLTLALACQSNKDTDPAPSTSATVNRPDSDKAWIDLFLNDEDYAPARFQQVQVKSTNAEGNEETTTGYTGPDGYYYSPSNFLTLWAKLVDGEISFQDIENTSLSDSEDTGDITRDGILTGLPLNNLPIETSAQVYLRFHPIIPEGNTNWSEWQDFEIETAAEGENLPIEAPFIPETTLTIVDNDKALSDAAPMWIYNPSDQCYGVVDRLLPDWADDGTTPILRYNGAASNNSEGASGYRLGSVITAEPDYSQGAVTLKQKERNFDYEACDLETSADEDTAHMIGLDDCFGGYTSHEKFYAIPADAFIDGYFGGGEAALQDFLAGKTYDLSEMEDYFASALEQYGGVYGFLSGTKLGSEDLGEDDNTSDASGNLNSLGIGKTDYTNYPIIPKSWGIDRWVFMSVEGDDGNGDDIIHPVLLDFSNIEAEDVVTDNSATLDNFGIREYVLTDTTKDYTAKYTFDYTPGSDLKTIADYPECE